jgi:hypothetical protein
MFLPVITAFCLAIPLTTPTGTDSSVDSAAATPTAQVTLAQAPEIWFVFPDEGAELDPVFIFGTNFGDFPVPFFGFIPSVPLYTFNTPELPFIGTLSMTITGVPFSFFPRVVDLTIVSNFQTSNAVDFRML